MLIQRHVLITNSTTCDKSLKDIIFVALVTVPNLGIYVWSRSQVQLRNENEDFPKPYVVL